MRAHLAQAWPGHEIEAFIWDLGPIRRRVPDFRVCRISPVDASEPWVYVSSGAWQVGPEAVPALEFLILSPREDPIHVETLAMVAYFHADPQYGLDIGRTVTIGRPWLDGSSADRLYVSRPYPYGSDLEYCAAADRLVRFCWLVPITAAEERFIVERGAVAFEEKLESSEVNVIAVNRPSVV